MKPLPYPDHHHLSAAQGWLMLGNPSEAEREFSLLNPRYQLDPDVMEFKWGIHAAAKNWKKAASIAHALRRIAPKRPFGWIHLAYSIRRIPSRGLTMAWEVLRPAHDLFPKDPLIVYNLACYAAQLKRPEEAWSWLNLAASLWGRDKVKAMALVDEDLIALKERIAQL